MDFLQQQAACLHASKRKFRIPFRGCVLDGEICGEGPPLLMLQGVGIYRQGCFPQVADLASRFSCITYDCRGTGLSQPVGDGIGVEQMVSDALAVMDALDVESAHVAGVSLGGLVAQKLALDARRRVKTLSLICTFPRGAAVLTGSAQSAWIALRTQAGTARMRRRAVLEVILPPERLAGQDLDRMADEWAAAIGHDLAYMPPVTKWQFAAMLGCDLRPRLGELAGISVLVVSAELDWVATPAVGRKLAGAIPGARFVELPGTAHGASVERAKELNPILMNHMSSFPG